MLSRGELPRSPLPGSPATSKPSRSAGSCGLPVMFGTGIALYFLLPVEPGLLAATLPAVAALVVHLTFGRSGLPALATAALLAAALGMAAGKLRTEATRAPVIERRMGPIDVYGFVELVEPRPSKGQRLTIRVAALEKHEPHAWPYRVRVRAMSETRALEPGDAVRLKATLSPPPGPALPGDYDFARAAWFQALGAVGYATAPPGDRRRTVGAAAVAACERRHRAGSAGHRPARRRDAARADRRHRQCAHHGTTRLMDRRSDIVLQLQTSSKFVHIGRVAVLQWVLQTIVLRPFPF